MKLPLITFLLLFVGAEFNSAGAEPSEVAGYNVERLATAIYHAEGGAKTRHPYGILAKYKTTTPRQACINTIRSKYRMWSTDSCHNYGECVGFLEFLASKYAPTIGNSLTNDERRLNIHWLKNVRYFYNRSQ